MARSLKRRIFAGFGVGFGLVLSALGGASCSGAEESLVSPCKSELECGQPCDNVSNACGSGKYCGTDSTCTAECIPGDKRCGDGKTCNGTGRCVASNGPDISIGGSSSSSGGGSGVCASTNVDLGHQLPTVLLLVDQSASMNADFGNSDRWQTLRTALMEPGVGIVDTLKSQVRFGLTLYSGLNGAAPCPALTNVAPALNNFAAIDTAYPVPTSAIIDDTPTGESITAAAAILAGVTEPGPKVIVLATDGEPDSCATPDPQTPEAKEMAIKAAQDAFATGIFTYYISVGNEVSDLHATEMANVGQGYQRGDKMQRFYRANDQAALAAAFTEIVQGVRTCSFQLNGTVKDGGETQGLVQVDGKTIPLDNVNGWRLSSPTTVELMGNTCDLVKDKDDHKVTAEFPCDTIVPFKPPA